MFLGRGLVSFLNDNIRILKGYLYITLTNSIMAEYITVSIWVSHKDCLALNAWITVDITGKSS